MPLQKLTFKPGINRDITNYANEGGWYECDKIRFRSGFPQKLGGWSKSIATPLIGRAYQLFGWTTTFSDNFLAIGTNKRVYIEVGTQIYNITPIRATLVSPQTDNCLTFTQGSTTVLVTITGHGITSGEYVTIAGAAGTLDPNFIADVPISEINKEHLVTVLSANTFTFEVQTPANIGIGWGLGDWGDELWGLGEPATVFIGGGNNITIYLEILAGNPITVSGYGWGTDGWSRSFWGSSGTEPVNLPQTDWWFDNFDNDLVMNIRNGAIYYWQRGGFNNPLSALSTRAVLLSSLTIDSVAPSDVPATAMQVLLSQNDKHLLAFGCTPYGGGSFDPLLIRWASQDQPNVWTPTTTNSAGFLRVSRGSKIVRALPTRQEIVVWTDTNLYSLQFLGTTDVFSLQELASNISIISPRSVVTVNNIVYWMGLDKFFAYSGRIETLPCTLVDHVFKNINLGQADQIVCGSNQEWNEIWWFYPSLDSNYNDSYVVYNYQENVWYYGTIDRTAWLDSPLRRYPQAIQADSDVEHCYLMNHEIGNDADGQPIDSYIQSSDIDLEDGTNFVLVNRLLPDVNFKNSHSETPELTLSVLPRNFPGSGYSTSPDDSKRVIQTTVNQYTDQVFIRARARQMALKIQSENLGVHWSLGAVRMDGRTDGKR